MVIEHDLPLISTIAMGLSLAFICGFIVSKFKMSPVVGYLFAGIVVGPHTPGFIASLEIAYELSEIGIVLLMFGVGLHFSFKDLMEVKNIAVTGAALRIVCTTVMGAGLAILWWGWAPGGAILYGLALSVASTVVLLRFLEQAKLQHSIDGRIAIGWLIVEDIIMVLAIVLIPVLAESEGMEKTEAVTGAVLTALGKVLLFAVVMWFAGRKILPKMLMEVNRTGSRELFTLAVLVAAIGVAFGASKFFDVSLALGAFFAGMIINSSQLNEEVASRVLPFQDAFAVLFFVSIGMLFDPIIILERPLGVIATSLIIIIFKFCVTFVIVLSFSYAVKRALSIAAGLAQIGEFSFILIGMGLTLGLLPAEGRDLVLAGAFLSIAVNPILFRLSHSLFGYIENHEVLSAFFTMRDSHSPALSDATKQVNNKHIILIGYGFLGEQVMQDVRNPRLDFIVIDTNREKIDALSRRGIEAIAGDAAEEETLLRADIGRAAAVVLAVPDPYETRRIIEAVRAVKPGVKILVSAANEDEAVYFEEHEIDLVLLGRREIGRGMVAFLNAIKV
ncbi:MAG: cation:proton antiporter [Alphaproteobacteria bacterium]|nr:cation:proton antiporter [Alphaproteobacteria bacterium]